MHFCVHMRKIMVLLLGVSLFVVTGCDFFRVLAGRPTSKDIETKKMEILCAEQEAQMAAEQALLEQEKMLKVSQDSLAALDSIKQYGGSVLNPAKLGGLFATKLEARYSIIVGAFILRSNAENMFVEAENAGYTPSLISFNNGLIAVGVCASNTIVEAQEALKKVRKERFYPKDVWILLNE